jgi:hypothetical protein
MGANSTTAADRKRFAGARALGDREAQEPSAVRAARYDGRRDAFELEFTGGGTMTIPRAAITELTDAPPRILKAVIVSPAGDALAWGALDVDVYIPGLLERVFGTRMLAASSGRRGGRRRSKAKGEAARANGAKGGRPRKRIAV